VSGPIRGLAAGQRPALVISECQRGLIDPEVATLMSALAAQAEQRSIARRISELAAAFRRASAPVAHCTIVPAIDWSGYEVSSPLAGATRKANQMREGDPAVDIHPMIVRHPDDILVPRRTGMTSFHGTHLEAELRTRGVTTVVVVGISTNIAVPGTALEAVNRGFNAVVVEDCTAGTSDEIHRFVVENLIPPLATVTSASAVVAALDELRGTS
jgi:nicotinamidase-related amidase